MSTKRQRRLDKKRKARRQKDLQARKKESLAYSGMKYKTDELVPFIFATERAIHEAFVITRRDFTDHDVRKALEIMIGRIRQNRLLPGERTGSEAERGQNAGNAAEFIVCNILFHWRTFFQTQSHLCRDKIVGVLRTILGSIDVWGNVSPKSRGYLEYIEDFLGQLGTEVRQVSKEELIEMGVSESLLADISEEPPESDEILEPAMAEQSAKPAKSRWRIPRLW
jgi:hypothetical protein